MAKGSFFSAFSDLFLVLSWTTMFLMPRSAAEALVLELDRRALATANTSKAGLAWPNGNTVDIHQYAVTGKVSWYYTWSVWPAGSWRTRNDLEFVPMLWGPKSINDFSSNINSVLGRKEPRVTAVLGMNEPEQRGQSNMTALEGAQMWKTYLEPLRSSGVRLGSPAASSAPAGKTWLQDFFTACNGTCNVDFIALHWYGTDADAFIAHLWDYWYTFNKTMWVTEWACHNFVDTARQCGSGDVSRFMNKTQAFMDNVTFVERYAWFGAMRDMQGVNAVNAIMDTHGKINALGRQYVGATADQLLSGAGLQHGVISPSLLMTITALVLGIHTTILS